jgi:hypothetical protein
MTESRKLILRKVGKNRDIIKIKFTEAVSPKLATGYLTAAFNQCFQHSFFKIILDMTYIDDPSPTLIATLIEATAKVRSKHGDVKIINVSDSAEQAIADFNAYAYLSVPREDVGK